MPADNWMRDGHPSLGWEARADADERRNKRIAGKWIAVLGISGMLIIGGLFALAKLL
jgi:hypothetical protein